MAEPFVAGQRPSPEDLASSRSALSVLAHDTDRTARADEAAPKRYQEEHGTMQPQNIYPYMPPPPGYTYQRVHPRAGIAIAALVLGILSLVLQWALGVGIVLGILAIVFAVRARRAAPSGMASAGLVCGIVGLVLSALWLPLEIASMGSSDTYYCNGRQVTQAEYDAC